MATCPVRFEFYCGEEELKYIHNVPRSLVAVGAQATRKEAGCANLFINTLQPIIKEHEFTCLANSNAFCEKLWLGQSNGLANTYVLASECGGSFCCYMG